MPIDPLLIPAPGSFSGVAQRLSDLDRRLRQQEATSGKIGANAIENGNIGDGAVEGPNIVANSITANHIQANSIVAGHITAGAIQATHIQAGAISAASIQAGSINASHIQANAITANAIAAEAVTAGAIAADAITAGTIAAGAVTAGSLAAGAVQSVNIVAGAVTTDKISVPSLSAVSGTLGIITAGIFQTASSGARVMMGTSINTSEGTKNGIIGLDASNNISFLIDPSNGDLRFKGVIQPGSSGLGNIQGLTQNVSLFAGGNLLNTNGSLTNTDLTPFYVTGATAARDTANFWTTPASLRLTSSGIGAVTLQILNAGGATSMPVAAGSPYSFAINIKSASNLPFTIGFDWYNSSGVWVSDTTETNATIANEWKRAAIENKTAPAGAAYAVPYIKFQSGAGQVAGTQFFIDDVIFVQAPVAAGAVVIADSITAAEIGVTTLSAITSNMGTLTAGTITGGSITGVTITGGTITGATITGGTFQTSSTDPKMVFNSFGLFTDARTNVNRLSVENTGLKSYNVQSGLEFWIEPDGDINFYNVPGALTWKAYGSEIVTGQLYHTTGPTTRTIPPSYIGPAQTNLYAYQRVGKNSSASVKLRAGGDSDAGFRYADLTIGYISTAPASSSAAIYVNGHSATLIDGSGRSSFVRTGYQDSSYSRLYATGFAYTTSIAADNIQFVTLSLPSSVINFSDPSTRWHFTVTPVQGSFMDYYNWAISSYSGSSVTIIGRNHSTSNGLSGYVMGMVYSER